MKEAQVRLHLPSSVPSRILRGCTRTLAEFNHMNLIVGETSPMVNQTPNSNQAFRKRAERHQRNTIAYGILSFAAVTSLKTSRKITRQTNFCESNADQLWPLPTRLQNTRLLQNHRVTRIYWFHCQNFSTPWSCVHSSIQEPRSSPLSILLLTLRFVVHLDPFVSCEPNLTS